MRWCSLVSMRFNGPSHGWRWSGVVQAFSNPLFWLWSLWNSSSGAGTGEHFLNCLHRLPCWYSGQNNSISCVLIVQGKVLNVFLKSNVNGERFDLSVTWCFFLHLPLRWLEPWHVDGKSYAKKEKKKKMFRKWFSRKKKKKMLHFNTS